MICRCELADNTQNATHGSDSHESAMREVRFFFPEMMLDPIPGPQQAQAILDERLKPTLVKALTAFAKEKPSSNR